MRFWGLVIAGVLVVGCSDDEPDAAPTTVAQEQRSTTTTTSTTTAPVVTTTPRPSPAQLEVTQQRVEAIYVGPEDISSELASTCADVLAGFTGDELTGRVVMRWSGGTRPDPTVEQAEAIAQVVATSEWCAP